MPRRYVFPPAGNFATRSFWLCICLLLLLQVTSKLFHPHQIVARHHDELVSRDSIRVLINIFENYVGDRGST